MPETAEELAFDFGSRECVSSTQKDSSLRSSSLPFSMAHRRSIGDCPGRMYLFSARLCSSRVCMRAGFGYGYALYSWLNVGTALPFPSRAMGTRVTS